MSTLSFIENRLKSAYTILMKQLLLILTFALTATSHAEETEAPFSERLALAQKVITINGPREALLNGDHAVTQHPFFQQIFAGMNFPMLDEKAAESMAVNFTAEELKALAAFLASPVGKSINQKMPRYQKVIGALIQNEMKRVADEQIRSGKLNPQQLQAPQAAPGSPVR